MPEITRETLELAALAAGHKIYGWCVLCNDRIAYADIGPEESVAWRPHLDDGDTARLAARLHITSCVNQDCAEAWLGDCSMPVSVTLVEVAHDGTDPDKLRAWREAVVLCAAAVGGRMRGER
jgi:hypothetical protein